MIISTTKFGGLGWATDLLDVISDGNKYIGVGYNGDLYSIDHESSEYWKEYPLIYGSYTTYYFIDHYKCRYFFPDSSGRIHFIWRGRFMGGFNRKDPYGHVLYNITNAAERSIESVQLPHKEFRAHDMAHNSKYAIVVGRIPYQKKYPFNGYDINTGNPVDKTITEVVNQEGMSPVARSSTGSKWTPMFGIKSNAFITAIAYGRKRFVCVGYDEAYYTTDYLNWVPMTGLNENDRIVSVIYARNRFIASGENSLYYSIDGESWIPMVSPSPHDNDRLEMEYGAGILFAGSRKSNDIWYTKNFTSWKKLDRELDLECITCIKYIKNNSFLITGPMGVSYRITITG